MIRPTIIIAYAPLPSAPVCSAAPTQLVAMPSTPA
jgi:hypothetical protein